MVTVVIEFKEFYKADELKLFDRADKVNKDAGVVNEADGVNEVEEVNGVKKFDKLTKSTMLPGLTDDDVDKFIKVNEFGDISVIDTLRCERLTRTTTSTKLAR